ncbi:MAG: hypothetical protein CMI27_01185 [Opitutae bacterium]|nr:hypothetical protein [Opitutae bacterium]
MIELNSLFIMNDNSWMNHFLKNSKFILRNIILLSVLFFLSCARESPEGLYTGEIKDWIHEVFEGKLVSSYEESSIKLILRQSPKGMIADMHFSHPKMNEIIRNGTWEVGDGERVIRFDDGKSPSQYYLIKRGVRYAFQSKEGLSNEDGSPILLMRNEGLSRKASYPLGLTFLDRGVARVEGAGANDILSGEWREVGGGVVVVAKLEPSKSANEKEEFLETYKYFLKWANEESQDLLLEKIVLMRPFLKDDGSKRQSWMSSLVFSDLPRLKPTGQ